MPAMTAAFASLRPEQLSDATPQLNVLQRIGGAIGTAVLAVVLQRASGVAPSPAKLAQRVRHRLLVVARDRAAALIPCVVLLRAESPRARLDRDGRPNAEATVEPLGRLASERDERHRRQPRRPEPEAGQRASAAAS